jgi:hypothetical protein
MVVTSAVSYAQKGTKVVRSCDITCKLGKDCVGEERTPTKPKSAGLILLPITKDPIKPN